MERTIEFVKRIRQVLRTNVISKHLFKAVNIYVWFEGLQRRVRTPLNEQRIHDTLVEEVFCIWYRQAIRQTKSKFANLLSDPSGEFDITSRSPRIMSTTLHWTSGWREETEGFLMIIQIQVISTWNYLKHIIRGSSVHNSRYRHGWQNRRLFLWSNRKILNDICFLFWDGNHFSFCCVINGLMNS